MSAKTITLTYEKKEYTLEFSRKVIENLELVQKVNLAQVEDMPYAITRKVIHAAFKKHHSQLKEDKIDEIWNAQKGKKGLIEALYDLVSEPYTELFGDDSADDKKNATWVKNW